MADGELTVRIDEELADDLRTAAAVKGVSVETFVRDALAQQVADREWSDDPDPTIDEAIVSKALSDGDALAWKDVRAWLSQWGKADEPPPPAWLK